MLLSSSILLSSILLNLPPLGDKSLGGIGLFPKKSLDKSSSKLFPSPKAFAFSKLGNNSWNGVTLSLKSFISLSKFGIIPSLKPLSPAPIIAPFSNAFPPNSAAFPNPRPTFPIISKALFSPISTLNPLESPASTPNIFSKRFGPSKTNNPAPKLIITAANPLTLLLSHAVAWIYNWSVNPTDIIVKYIEKICINICFVFCP